MPQENFHPDLEKIQQEYQTRLGAAEGEMTPEKEKEVLKQVIAERFQAVSQDQTTQADKDASAKAAEKPLEKSEARGKYQYAIDALIRTAFEKGLTKAVQEVRNMGNAFLIDAFHDELVNKFYSEIKSRENA